MAPLISQLPRSLIPLGYMETEQEGVPGRVSSTTQSSPLRGERCVTDLGPETTRPLHLHEGSSISIENKTTTDLTCGCLFCFLVILGIKILPGLEDETASKKHK